MTGKYQTKVAPLFKCMEQASELFFDWFEEECACVECNNFAFHEEDGQLWLSWNCNYCEGGEAKLEIVMEY